MKILSIITKANWGGAQKYVCELAVAARERGHEVVVATGGTGPLVEKLSAAGIRVIPLGVRQRHNFWSDLFSFGSLAEIVRVMRAEQPDVVHANSAKAGGLGCLAARIAGVPRVIFTAHGWEFNAPRNFFSRLGMRFFSWLTILLSTETICVSQAIYDDATHFPFVKNKLRVIHNGISCSKFFLRENARVILLPDQEKKDWMGMVSELHPTKRIEDSIEAFALIHEKYPETILVVLGEGSERAKLERLIRAHTLEKKVFLPGFVADAPQYEKAFDIFLHTPQSEALGYAILEAGCASLPVVATRVGGIPEIIEDGVSGLLAPPHNPRAIAAALEKLLNDPARASQLGARLHSRILADFSQTKMLDATFACYGH